MSFQLETVLYLLGIFQCVQAMALLYSLEHSSRVSNRYLYLFFGLIIISLADSVAEAEGLFRLWPHGLMVSNPAILLYGPFFYMYVLRMTGGQGALRWHLIPFVLSMFIYAPFIFGYSGDAKYAVFYEADPWNVYETVITVGMTVVELLQIGLYLYYSRLRLRLYQRYLDDHYSEQSAVTLEWLTYMIYSSVLVFVCYFIDFLSYHIISAVQVLWVLFFSWLNFAFLIKSKRPVTVDTPSKAPVSSPQMFSASDVADFDARVKSERLYLQEELTLLDLSAHFALPEYRISQMLNQGLGVTFYDYINTLRIDYAKALLRDPGYGANILTVAFDSGFKSRSAFYNAFQKQCGMTPSAFKKG